MPSAQRQSFDGIVHEIGPRVLRMACLLTGDRPAAEDLAQSCLLRLFDRWRRGNLVVDDWGAYAVRALVNTYASDRRLFRNKKELSASELPEEPSTPHDEEIVNEVVLVGALKCLPPAQRTAVVLRFCYDYSEHETSLLMGRPVGTVKSLTSRGLAQLRTLMPLAGMSPYSSSTSTPVSEVRYE